MTIGRAIVRLARSEHATEEERAAVVAVLGPLISRLQHDLDLTADALRGPDPEYALSLFVDVIHEIPASLRSVDAALSAPRTPARPAPRPLRAVA